MFVICALRDKGDCEWHQSTFPSAGILKKAYTTLNPITIIKLTGLFSTDLSCYFKVCRKQWLFTFFSHKVSYFTNVRGISLKIGIGYIRPYTFVIKDPSYINLILKCDVRNGPTPEQYIEEN